MYVFETRLRVHYALTDQMGMVYYGNYAQFFEIARTEAIRNLGFTYKSLEEQGTLMPVADYHVRFIQSVAYDELITIRVTLKEWPIRKRIIFYGEIFNEAGEKCTTGDVTLFFVDAKTKKLVNIPPALENILAPYFSNSDQ